MSIVNHNMCTDYEWNNGHVRLYHSGKKKGYIVISCGTAVDLSIGLIPLLLYHPAHMTSNQRRAISNHLRFALK